MPEMSDKHLFEYAVVRVVPRVEREEFVNIGVILYCPAQRYLKVLYSLNQQRLLALCPGLATDALEEYLGAMVKICKGSKEGGTIGLLPLASRFRWLTATRSSIVQTSRVHPGFCEDPDQTLLHLMGCLVD